MPEPQNDPFAAYAVSADPFSAFVVPTPSHASTVPTRTWTDTAVDALPMIGGALGGIVGGIGGTVAGVGVGGAPGAIGGAAVGGAAGESARQLVERARGRLTTADPVQAAKDIGTQAAIQGASEAGGEVIGKGLRLVGRGMYRAGALPIMNVFDKYGDVIGMGVENRIPVTKAGLEKAAGLKATAQTVKQTAIDAADRRGGVWTKGVTQDALGRVATTADDLTRAGYPNPTGKFLERAQRVEAANGRVIAPSELESLKSTIDDQLGLAYRKLRAREPLTAGQRMDMALSQAAGDTQATLIPNYRALNKDVMDAEGLRRVIQRRLKGNQGLENAMTAAVGLPAVPARLAMLPGVASTAGIATHMLGERPNVSANAIRAALASLMSAHQPESE